ncbi:hypothetical protein QTP88_014030 [Uroleucon formosanum]
MSKLIFLPSEDEVLVQEVQNNPVFYNMADSNYKNNIIKDDIWKDISTKIGKSCKSRRPVAATCCALETVPKINAGSAISLLPYKNGKQTVECVDKKLTSVTLTLGIDPATQVMDISDNDLSAAVAGLHHDKGLTNLVDLNLSSNCLRQVSIGAFAECPSLANLSLSDNLIGNLPARASQHLGQLTILDLSGCGLTTITAGTFDDLSGLDNLLTDVGGSNTLPALFHGPATTTIGNATAAWLTSTASRVPVTEEPVCSGPAAYVNVPVRRVSVAELACAAAAYPATQPMQDVS